LALRINHFQLALTKIFNKKIKKDIYNKLETN
jgi:hypothetical protein